MTAIPEMTDPRGKQWQQPPRERVAVDDQQAMVSQADFDLLLDYTGSRPTGVYLGKMWRAKFRDVWWLAWYEACKDPTKAATQWRRLVVIS